MLERSLSRGATRPLSLLLREGGQAAMALIVLVMVLLAGAVFMLSYNSASRGTLANEKQRMLGDLIASEIQSNLKAVLTNPAAITNPACLPASLSPGALKVFQTFVTPIGTPVALVSFSAKISGPTTKLPSFPCLYGDGDLTYLSSVSVTITELSHDPDSLMRNVNISVVVGMKQAKGTVLTTVNSSHDYRLQALSLSNFGLVFDATPTGSFVSLGANVQLTVFSTTLFADTASPTFDQLVPAKPSQLTFNHYVFGRFSQLSSANDMSVNGFLTSYQNGIQTGVLPSAAVGSYLPNASSNAWNYRYFYRPLYENTSYPIPEYITSSGGPAVNTGAVCYSGTLQDNNFVDNQANLNVLPDTTGQIGPPSLASTCTSNTSRPMVFLFNRAATDLTINFSPGDSNFCGLVVANTLRINVNVPPGVPATSSYALIGHFTANQIVVNATGATGPVKVQIYNPEEPTPLDSSVAPLPGGQSLANLSSNFKSLASSTAWNYYVPWAANPPAGFGVHTSSDFMMSCSSIYTYQSSYQPMPALTGFGNFQNGSAGPLFSMVGL